MIDTAATALDDCMELVKTRRFAAMQKMQRAKAGMKPLVKPGPKKDAWPAAPFGPARLEARRDSPRFAGGGRGGRGQWTSRDGIWYNNRNAWHRRCGARALKRREGVT